MRRIKKALSMVDVPNRLDYTPGECDRDSNGYPLTYEVELSRRLEVPGARMVKELFSFAFKVHAESFVRQRLLQGLVDTLRVYRVRHTLKREKPYERRQVYVYDYRNPITFDKL